MSRVLAVVAASILWSLLVFGMQVALQHFGPRLEIVGLISFVWGMILYEYLHD